MEEYISKSALVAEIENRINKYILLQQKPEMSDLQKELQNKIDCLNSIKGYIFNTLEVKEVDLEEYYNEFLQKEWFESLHVRTVSEMMAFTAKHFFELGMQVSNKAQKGE